MAIAMRILLSFTAVLLYLCNFNVAGVSLKYVIVTPEKIRSGQPLDIYFNVDNDGTNFPTSGTVIFSLQGTSYIAGKKTITVILSKKFDIDVTKPNIVFLDIPYNIDKTYVYALDLKAEGEFRFGSSVVRFSNTTKLTYDKKSLSLFIQTDKAMYKPGQLVNYRVIGVYPDLKPLDKQFSIEIYDPRNNKIIQNLNATQEFKGVVCDSLQLTEEPIQGSWTITVTYGTEKVEKAFIVEEYVLPKFEVKVKAPSYIVYNGSKDVKAPITTDVHFTTEVLYTHGKPVEGSVVVDITLYRKCSYRCPKYKTIKKHGLINKQTGRADFILKANEILALSSNQNSWQWNKLDIMYTAVATETVSGIALNGTGNTKIHLNALTAKFLSSTPENYKLGLLYTGFWKITQVDGSPITEDQLKNERGESQLLSVEIKYIWMYNKTIRGQIYSQRGTPQTRVKTFPVSQSGLVLVTFTPPKSNVMREMWFDEIELKATFKDRKAYKNLNQFVTKKTKVGLQLTIQNNGAINPDEELRVLMTTTVPIPSFTYILISRGRLIASKSVTMDGQLEKEFTVLISKDISRKIAPSARLLSFTKSAENEMVADSIEFNVNGLFSNDVQISFNKDKVSPGDDIDLKIQASPNSFLALLAVDTSVLLLGGGNDLESKHVMDEVKKYDSSSVGFYPYGRMMFRRKRSIGYWPMRWGAQDTSTILTNAGVRMMTDALIYKKIVYPDMIAFNDANVRGAGGGIQMFGMKRNKMRANVIPENMEKSNSENVEEPSRVRKLFPETWLWFEKNIGPTGHMTLQAKVPDTITSWVATAFAMSETDGLGVAEGAKVTVFKSFFIRLSLPYSVIRGEEFKLQVLVFNYLNTAQKVRISLKIPPNSFVARNGKYLDKEVSNAWASKIIDIEPNSAESVNFWVEPKVLGNIPLFVMAKAPLAADSLERNLLVEAEGSREEYSKSTFLRLSKEAGDNSTSTEFYVALPPSSILVSDSQYISMTVIGDIMGKSMNSLESLIRMPYGCGEQNMINFVPNIVAMDYMTASGQVTESIKKKAIKYMTAGYQRELTYQRTDGSFSAFGNRDKSGSLWLTDYVAKSFISASKYIFVDPKIIDKAIKFIMSRQGEEGNFTEPLYSKVIHAGMQGGTSKGLTLTAYTLATLIEASRVVDKSRYLSNIIDKSLQYLDKNADKHFKDPYTLAVLSYTYQLARLYHTSYKSTKDNEVWDNLQKLANEEEGMKWWKTIKKEVKCPRKWCSSYNTAKASDVELAAYALLVYSMKSKYKDDIDTTLPVLRWMLAQTNEKGAFKSTQDTVVGLAALAKYSSMILGGNEKNLKITLSYGDSSHEFNLIANNNATILQQAVIPKDTKTISVKASGYGTAVVQMNVNYNVKDSEGEPPKLHSKLTQINSPKGVQLTSCLKFNPENGEESGMIVTELNVLSGHFVDSSELLQEYGNIGLKRVENNGKKINLYWDVFGDSERCFDIYVQRKDAVVNVQPAEIVHYLYYDVEERSSHMYSSEKRGYVLNLSKARLAACNDCSIDYVKDLRDDSHSQEELPINPIGSSSSTRFGIWITVLALIAFFIL